jgi:hypothetical protein
MVVEEIMDDGRGDVAGEWVDLGQFARRLGIARSSVYGRVRRGTLQTRPKGNRGLEIFWQPSRHHRENGSGHAAPMVASNGVDVAGDVLVAAQVAELRERLAAAKAECLAARAVAIADVATAQAEVAAKDQIIADLREQVQWLRLPWWRRMLGP